MVTIIKTIAMQVELTLMATIEKMIWRMAAMATLMTIMMALMAIIEKMMAADGGEGLIDDNADDNN